MKKRREGENLNPISRRFCFTIYPENLPEHCFSILSQNDLADKNGTFYAFHIDKEMTTETISVPGTRGIIWSLEEGDTKEHAHIQGYCELFKPMRLFKFTNLLAFCKAHTEKAEGDRDANFSYICHTGKHKDKGVLHLTHQYGSWPQSGGYERNACDEAVRMVLDGASVPEVLSLFGGSLLWAVSSLSRLQDKVRETEYEKEEKRRSYLKWRMLEHPEDYENIPF